MAGMDDAQGSSGVSRAASSLSRGHTAIVVLLLMVGLCLSLPEAFGSPALKGNGLIAFSTGRQIFTVRPDGSSVRKVTRTRTYNRAPAWARDGSRLAFSCGGNARNDRDICIARPDGSRRRTLTQDDVIDSTPTWSPDRTTLAFTRDTDTGSQIFLIDRDGENLTQLTHNPVSASAPEWSPDGGRILFTAWGLANKDIFSIRVDGSDEINLTQTPETETWAGWSPTGDAIVFDRIVDGEGYQLFVAAADGSGASSLNVAGSTPSWSPNGRRILGTAFRGNNLRCFTVKIDGSDQRFVSPKGMDCYTPDWQPR